MIRTERHGAVSVIVIDNPPVNAFGAAIRRGIEDALDAARGDDAVQAVVLRGAGRLFSGGADITEFTRPSVEPYLPEMLDRIEAGSKPVIAAMHGTCFGGGLEMALSCHYRVAAPSARLGLPEVKIGLLPGAGGTQRLPRLVGVPEALATIVSGDPVDAARALATGLIDRIVREESLTEDAVAFAREVAIPGGPRRARDRAVEAAPEMFETFLASQGGKLRGRDAPAACIEAIRASATMPIADGLARERALFIELASGRQSMALRHIFFAERAAAKILEEGIAQRAADIDLVWVHGYGWPATTGGPLFWADGIGLETIVAGLEAHRARLGADAEISTLLARKAAEHGRFNG